MAKYDSMQDYIRHLKYLNRHKPFSTTKVDELVLALQDGPKLSSEIKSELAGGHWDAIYSAIHGEIVETEYWKHSNRMYWLTQAGKTYCKFLLKVQERISETESDTDEIQGQSAFFPKIESYHSKSESQHSETESKDAKTESQHSETESQGSEIESQGSEIESQHSKSESQHSKRESQGSKRESPLEKEVGSGKVESGNPPTNVGNPPTNVGNPPTNVGNPPTKVGSSATKVGSGEVGSGNPTTKVGSGKVGSGNSPTKVGSSGNSPTTSGNSPTTSGNSPTTATEVAKSIGATILNDSQRKNVEHLLGYYKCLLLADETNRSEGIFLVSTELDHCVVQINGSMAERVQMLELIKQLSQQEKQNDNT